MRIALVAAVLVSGSAFADSIAAQPNWGESPKNMAIELRVGPFYPLVDRPFGGTGPYSKTFGGGQMLLGEAEIDRQLWQKFGSLGIGIVGGYTEKYGHAIADATGEETGEAVSLQLVPMKLLAVYRFDWLNMKYGIPLVPFVKFGFEAVYWWASKGGQLEVVDNLPGRGFSFGYTGAAGLMFLLDILDPRLARDFDSGVGVNHSYVFAEANFAEVNNFDSKNAKGVPNALDLSSRFVMFGLAFEY